MSARRPRAARRVLRPRTAVALALALALLGGCAEGPERPARVRYNQGLAALVEGKLDDAVAAFLEARGDASGDPELRLRAAYNLGLAHARRGEAAAADGPERDLEAAIDAYQDAATWFSDALRLAPDDAEARANLERVQARVLAMVDELNRGERGLERRLEQLIAGERALRDQVRGLWQAQDARGAGADPLADRDAFEAAATRQRVVAADAGVVADLAGDEITAIGGKAEAQRSDEEQARLVQLKNLDLYVQDARKEMTDARRNLAELQGELAYRRTEGALEALKRAREQLLDPVTVLRGVAADQLELAGHAAAVDEARGGVRLGAAPPSLPAWMEPVRLGGRQLDLRARLEEVKARLAAGAQADDAAGGPGASAAGGAGDDPQAAERARLRALIGQALPAVEEASGAMMRATEALRGGDVKGGLVAQREALAAMARAIEVFLDLRGLVDLALAEQGQVVAALTPPAEGDAALSPADRARVVGDGVTRNHARVVRMQEMIATLAASAQAGAGGAAPDPADPQAQAAQAEAEQAAALYARAEVLRAEALVALEALRTVAGGGKGAPALESATTAHRKLEELQQLFFSVIEHLKRLVRDQGETRDRTAVAVGQDDLARRPLLPGLVEREGEHARAADAIAQALAAQADAAAQAEPGPAAGAGGPDPKALREAAGEVRNALGTMHDASDTLSRAADPTATMSFDLSPALDAQGKALEHLENALRLLQPPPQQPDPQQQQQQDQQQDQQQQQQQQQQQSKDEAQRRLQQVREREAQRERERRERQRLPSEPVDRDW